MQVCLLECVYMCTVNIYVNAYAYTHMRISAFVRERVHHSASSPQNTLWSLNSLWLAR